MWRGDSGTSSSSSNTEEIQSVLRREQELRPECSFSSSESQSCSMQNGGNYVCETIKSIFRRCPNERPCEIYRQSEKSDDQSLPNERNNNNGNGIFYSKSWSSSSSSSSSSDGSGGGIPHEAIEGMFEDAFKMFDGVMGASGGFGRIGGGLFGDRDDRNDLGPHGIFGEMFKAFAGADPLDGNGRFGGGNRRGGDGGMLEGPAGKDHEKLPPHVRARAEKEMRKIEGPGESI